jgi:hypothetical protein
VQLQLSPSGGLDPDLDPGDDIRVTEAPEPPPGAEPAGPAYSPYDFQRGTLMLVLTLVFVAVMLLFARLRGALSLLGLGASLVVALVFVLLAILDDKPPLAVAVVGSLAIALITIPLAHARGPKSLAAVLGTSASLLLTALLALVFTEAAHLTGFSNEEAVFLQVSGADLSLEGLLLAGMVVGALGVLDDVTVSQASTVLALRGANPALRFRELVGSALRVGRDHVSATVNTLVLAYVGGSLPVLLIFSSANLGLAQALNLEVVAKEVVRHAGGVDRPNRGRARHDRSGGAASAGRAARAAGSDGARPPALRRPSAAPTKRRTALYDSRRGAAGRPPLPARVAAGHRHRRAGARDPDRCASEPVVHPHDAGPHLRRGAGAAHELGRGRPSRDVRAALDAPPTPGARSQRGRGRSTTATWSRGSRRASW